MLKNNNNYVIIIYLIFISFTIINCNILIDNNKVVDSSGVYELKNNNSIVYFGFNWNGSNAIWGYFINVDNYTCIHTFKGVNDTFLNCYIENVSLQDRNYNISIVFSNASIPVNNTVTISIVNNTSIHLARKIPYINDVRRSDYSVYLLGNFSNVNPNNFTINMCSKRIDQSLTQKVDNITITAPLSYQSDIISCGVTVDSSFPYYTSYLRPYETEETEGEVLTRNIQIIIIVSTIISVIFIVSAIIITVLVIRCIIQKKKEKNNQQFQNLQTYHYHHVEAPTQHNEIGIDK